MLDIQDSLNLDFENFNLFTPHYSNLKSGEVLQKVDMYLLRRQDREFQGGKFKLYEVVIYNCLLTAFSIQLSNEDQEDLKSNFFISHRYEYRMCGDYKYIPPEYFNKLYMCALLIERISTLDKKALSIVIQIILKFLNIGNEGTWGDFYDNFSWGIFKYAYEKYEDSMIAFRTFLVWLDINLADKIKKTYKDKGSDDFVSLQKLIKAIIEKLPKSTIKIEIEDLPENWLELISLYNPEFISRKEQRLAES